MKKKNCHINVLALPWKGFCHAKYFECTNWEMEPHVVQQCWRSERSAHAITFLQWWCLSIPVARQMSQSQQIMCWLESKMLLGLTTKNIIKAMNDKPWYQAQMKHSHSQSEHSVYCSFVAWDGPLLSTKQNWTASFVPNACHLFFFPLLASF